MMFVTVYNLCNLLLENDHLKLSDHRAYYFTVMLLYSPGGSTCIRVQDELIMNV